MLIPSGSEFNLHDTALYLFRPWFFGHSVSVCAVVVRP